MTEPLGSRTPTWSVHPSGVPGHQWGLKVLDAIGLPLDPWQVDIYRALNMRNPRTGHYAATEAGLIVPRQSGKTHLILAHAITACLEHDDITVLWTSHRMSLSREVMRIVLALTDGFLGDQVADIFRGVGLESVIFKTNSRIRFLARSEKTGRGMSPAILIADEGMFLTEEHLASVVPGLSAQPWSQTIITSSAGFMNTPLHAIRDRGRAGDGSGELAYAEWAADDGDDPADPHTWAKANPGLGTRISHASVRREQRALPAPVFATERLGIWQGAIVTPSALDAVAVEQCLTHPAGPDQVGDDVAVGWDVAVDRSRATVCVAWRDTAGRLHVQVVQHGPDPAVWLAQRLEDLDRRWPGVPILHDSGGGIDDVAVRVAATHHVTSRGLPLKGVAAGCADLKARIEEASISIGRSVPMVESLVTATARQLGASWVFDRRGGEIPPTAVFAAVLALHPLVQADGIPEWRIA